MKVCHVRYNSTLRGKLNLLKMKQSHVNPFYERPAWMTRCALFCDKKFATVANSCGFVSMFSRFTVLKQKPNELRLESKEVVRMVTG